MKPNNSMITNRRYILSIMLILCISSSLFQQTRSLSVLMSNKEDKNVNFSYAKNVRGAKKLSIVNILNEKADKSKRGANNGKSKRGANTGKSKKIVTNTPSISSRTKSSSSSSTSMPSMKSTMKSSASSVKYTTNNPTALYRSTTYTPSKNANGSEELTTKSNLIESTMKPIEMVYNIDTFPPSLLPLSLRPIPKNKNASVQTKTNTPTKMQTNNPTKIKKRKPAKEQTNAPTKMTNAPTRAQTNTSTKIENTPTKVTNAPTIVQTNTLSQLEINAPSIKKTNNPTKMATNAPIVQTNASIKVQTNAPIKVQSNVPSTVKSNTPTEIESNEISKVQSNPPAPINELAKEEETTTTTISKTQIPFLLTDIYDDDAMLLTQQKSKIYPKLSVAFTKPNNITRNGLLSNKFPDIIKTLQNVTIQSICNNNTFFDVLSLNDLSYLCNNRIVKYQTTIALGASSSTKAFKSLRLNDIDSSSNSTVLAINQTNALSNVTKMGNHISMHWYEIEFIYQVYHNGRSLTNDEIELEVQNLFEKNLQLNQTITTNNIIVAISNKGKEQSFSNLQTSSSQNNIEAKSYHSLRIVGISIFLLTNITAMTLCIKQNHNSIPILSSCKKVTKNDEENNNIINDDDARSFSHSHSAGLSTTEGVEEILNQSRIIRSSSELS